MFSTRFALNWCTWDQELGSLVLKTCLLSWTKGYAALTGALRTVIFTFNFSYQNILFILLRSNKCLEWFSFFINTCKVLNILNLCLPANFFFPAFVVTLFHIPQPVDQCGKNVCISFHFHKVLRPTRDILEMFKSISAAQPEIFF